MYKRGVQAGYVVFKLIRTGIATELWIPRKSPHISREISARYETICIETKERICEIPVSQNPRLMEGLLLRVRVGVTRQHRVPALTQVLWFNSKQSDLSLVH